MIITIDGPMASGKSTVAQLLARKLQFYYLNTGLLYRALTFILLEKLDGDVQALESTIKNITKHDLEAITKTLSYSYHDEQAHTSYKGDNITSQLTTPHIAQASSLISPHAHVREVVNNLQRFIAQEHDIVIEGRDSGTVVFPHADVKFFLTADPRIRAQRLLDDPKRKAVGLTLEKAQALLEQRDARDSKRKLAPLRKADDAIEIDNSDFGIDETIEMMMERITLHQRKRKHI